MTLEYGDTVPDNAYERVGDVLARLLDASAVGGVMAPGAATIRGKLPLADKSNGWEDAFYDNHLDVDGPIFTGSLLRLSVTRPPEEDVAATFVMFSSITANGIDDRDEVNSVHLTRSYSPSPVDARYVRWKVIRRQGQGGFTGGWSGGGFVPPSGTFVGTRRMEVPEDVVLYSGSVSSGGVLSGFPAPVEDDTDWSLTVQYNPSEPTPRLLHDGGSVDVSYEIRVYLRP